MAMNKTYPLFQNSGAAIEIPVFGVVDPLIQGNVGVTVLTETMAKAIFALLWEQRKETTSMRKGFLPETHLAVGTLPTNDGDVIVVEYQETTEIVHVFWRNVKTGECAGFLLNPGTGEKHNQILMIPSSREDGTAVMASFAFELAGMLQTDYDFVWNSLEALSSGNITHDEAWDNFRKVIPNFVEAIVDNVNINMTSSYSHVANKKTYNYEIPSLGEKVPAGVRAAVGEFKYLGVNSSEVEMEDISLEGVKKFRSFAEYSADELAKIPVPSPVHVRTQKEILLKHEIARTRAENKREEDALKYVMLVGPTGSGKTEIVREICADWKIPLEIFMCSAYTTEEDFNKKIIPVVSADKAKGSALLSDEERKAFSYLSETGRSGDQDELGKLLGIPTIAECYFDSKYALEQLGITEGDLSHTRAVTERNNALMRRVMAIQARLPKEAVSYEVIDSPLVEAVKKGHALELQELTNIREQGIMSALFDVLDSSSRGTMQTIDGPVIRHPDFFCFATANTGYVGNNDISAATLRRFRFVAVLDDLTKEELKKRVTARLGSKRVKGNMKLVDQMVNVFIKARTQAMNMYKSPSFEASPQQLFDFADAVLDGVNRREAFVNYIQNHLAFDPDDAGEIWAAVEDASLFRG